MIVVVVAFGDVFTYEYSFRIFDANIYICQIFFCCLDISLDTYQKFNVFTHAVLREAVVAMHGCGSSVTLLDHSRVDKLCCHDIVS